MTTRITGFERRRVHGQELIGSETLELPPSSIETTGIWLEIPDEIPAALRAANLHPMGGLHAVEHTALSMFPLLALCDRHDVGGITTLAHPQVGRAAIFLYDGAPGGMGLATSLFDRVETLLEATLERVRDCPCEEGCPACVHSPKCGNGNRPIDKAGALRALALLLAHESLPRLERRAQERARRASSIDRAGRDRGGGAAPRLLRHRDPAQRRGGRRLAQRAPDARRARGHLGRARRALRDLARARRTRLLARLAEADLVVGFNVRGFDYQVLRGYTETDPGALPTFDLLDAIRDRIGFRLPLGHLAEENLGVAKGADGLQSLAWWKEGRVDEIENYCRRDVELLRDLFGTRGRAPAPALPHPGRRARADSDAVVDRGAPGARPGRATRRASVQHAPAAPHAHLEDLEVQVDEHVAQLRRQRRDDAAGGARVVDVEDLGEHRFELAAMRDHGGAQRARILAEGRRRSWLGRRAGGTRARPERRCSRPSSAVTPLTASLSIDRIGLAPATLDDPG